jgi:energy-coupling factor transporter transmembrane protein EcfT
MKKLFALVIIIPIILGVMIYNEISFRTFWVLVGMYLFVLIYTLHTAYKTFQEKYYVLNHYGKEAYFMGELTSNINNHLDYVCFIGSFQACCDYLNQFNNTDVGLIVDEDINPVGRIDVNNKWIPVR